MQTAAILSIDDCGRPAVHSIAAIWLAASKKRRKIKTQNGKNVICFDFVLVIISGYYSLDFRAFFAGLIFGGGGKVGGDAHFRRGLLSEGISGFKMALARP